MNAEELLTPVSESGIPYLVHYTLSFVNLLLATSAVIQMIYALFYLGSPDFEIPGYNAKDAQLEREKEDKKMRKPTFPSYENEDVNDNNASAIDDATGKNATSVSKTNVTERDNSVAEASVSRGKASSRKTQASSRKTQASSRKTQTSSKAASTRKQASQASQKSKA